MRLHPFHTPRLTQSTCTKTTRNVVFQSNNATNLGGAIYVQGAGLTLGSNASFVTKKGTGADMFIQGQPSTFSLTGPFTSTGSMGARAVYVNGSAVAFPDDTSFYSASTGAILMTASSNVTIGHRALFQVGLRWGEGDDHSHWWHDDERARVDVG